MPILPHVASLARNLFRKPAVERDLDDEVRACLQQMADRNVRDGMPPREALRAAALELGGVEQVKEEIRDARRGHMSEELFQDLRYAVRTLSKSPGFTAVAVLALALGIGANTAMFSVAYGILLRPLPYPQADRIALVYMDWLHRNNPRANMSMADFLDWRLQNHAFAEPAAYSGMSRFDITGDGRSEQIQGAAVTAGFFPTLRVPPLAGRLFAANEDRPGAPHLAVIGESLWRRRFGGSPNALGQTMILNGEPRTIIGVMPGAFHFPRPDSEVWTNIELIPPTRHGPYFLRGIARLKPGVTMEQARAECDAIGRWIEQQNPKIYAQLHLPVLSLRNALTERVSTMLVVLAGAVGLVLLITVANVANLSLARATVREREMALRLSLGASRSRLVRQLLTESVLLSALGGTAGLALAYGAIELLRGFNPGNLPRIGDIRLDGVAVAFVSIVSLLTGVLFGLYPALQSARADLNSALKEGGRSGTGARRQRARSAMVVAEVALSLMLLVGAGLLLRSFVRLQQVDAGFHVSPRQILSLTISPAARQYADEARGIRLYTRLLQRIQQVPGLDSVAISDGLPPAQEADADTFTIQGQILPSDASNPIVSVGIVSPDYFRTIGVPLRQGRYFTAHDTAIAPPVAIVSENFARRFFPGENPLGKRIKESGPSLTENPFMEIVGVVGDLKYMGLDRQDDAAYYMPYTQDYARRTFLVVRSARNVASLAPLLRREVQAIDADIVIGSVSTLAEDIAASVARPRFDTWLLGAFAGIALLLAIIGIYGVIAYSVAQRTHEIGVRMALGAGRGSVIAMVLAQGARLAAVGVALGLGGAFALTRLLGTLLFGVSVTDAFTFIAVALGLFSVALLASLIPAQRATRILPAIALR